MKISDFKNEEALDLLADILEPASEIIADEEVKKAYKNKGNKLTLAKIIIKNHKSAIIEILARLNGKAVEEYTCNVFTLPIKLIEILNDEELVSFFNSSAGTEENNVSADAMGVTMETVKM